MVEGRRIKMAVDNIWIGYETWARVFSFLKARAVMTQNQTRNCSYLCYRSIATKREMIRFASSSRRESRFLMTSQGRIQGFPKGGGLRPALRNAGSCSGELTG